MTVHWIDFLTDWTFRPAVIGLCAALIVLYRRGRRKDDESTGSTKFYLSQLIILVALLSPINRWARHFFFFHVAQHLLLISLVPALFMGSNSLPTLFKGVPTSWQNHLTPILQRWRPTITKLTPKNVCWYFFVATVWLWYDPNLHALTLQSSLLYNLAIVMMMSGALLHWWHVMGAAPQLHARLPGFTHMGYAFLGAAPLKIPGLIFLFAYLPFYSYASGTFLGFDIDPLLSQRLGGIVVWSLGGVVYSTTAFSFLSDWLSVEADKPEQPRSVWDNKETFIAPHLDRNAT